MNLIFITHIIALLFSFFVAGALIGALLSKPLREKIIDFIRGRRDLLLARVINNPVLKPGTHPWNTEAVMNPAAILLGGRVHLLYRAIGMDGISRLGYASSPNGFVFDEQLPYPAYVSQNVRDMPGAYRRYSPVMYPSGGSWGGCEDPRMVALDGRIYVTYNAFDGWDFMRVAFVSIPEKDFLAKRFYNWSRPRLISPPGQRHKNWVIFPEKVRGKFTVLHSIVPEIEIAYLDSLDAVGDTAPFIESWEGARADAVGNGDGWDKVVRSAGPPPIKTEYGWLVLYHATRENERHLYQVGAMLLDLEDPTKVLHRATIPVLSPNASYENDGKPGIVYAAGAVVRGGMLYVYYGGADKVVCVAMAPLMPFLKALIEDKEVPLSSVPLQTI